MIIPKYSTDIQSAWSVVEKVASEGFHLDLRGSKGRWIAVFSNDKKTYGTEGITAPHAICLAALKVFEKERL